MSTPPAPSPAPDQQPVEVRRVICTRCGARAWLEADRLDIPCATCGGVFRPMGFLAALVDRWFAPAEHVSEFYPRHLKLIELMWQADGRGEDTYRALGLERVSYSQFVRRATQVVVKGLNEGWIEARIPPGPLPDDTRYSVHFVDPDRWAHEIEQAFTESQPPSAESTASTRTIE